MKGLVSAAMLIMAAITVSAVYYATHTDDLDGEPYHEITIDPPSGLPPAGDAGEDAASSTPRRSESTSERAKTRRQRDTDRPPSRSAKPETRERPTRETTSVPGTSIATDEGRPRSSTRPARESPDDGSDEIETVPGVTIDGFGGITVTVPPGDQSSLDADEAGEEIISPPPTAVVRRNN